MIILVILRQHRIVQRTGRFRLGRSGGRIESGGPHRGVQALAEREQALYGGTRRPFSRTSSPG